MTKCGSFICANSPPQTQMGCKSISLAVFLSLVQWQLILAEDKPCGKHDVKVNYFRNCQEPSAKDQNIRIHNVTLKLTDDCKFVARGCFQIKKAIKSGQVEYYISKPPFKKKDTEDFCEMLATPETQKNIENYKTLPRKCTIQPGEYCMTKGSTKVEQLNPKTLNMLSGTTTGYFIIENESKDKGCVEFKMTVTKKE